MFGFGGANHRVSVNSTGGRNHVVVNGVSYDLPPGNVSINNGVIYVNGQRFDTGGAPAAGVVEVRIVGEALAVTSDASVTVEGDVRGNVQAGGSVKCGNVGGSVSAGGSIKADGKLGGNVSAGGSVRIG